MRARRVGAAFAVFFVVAASGCGGRSVQHVPERDAGDSDATGRPDDSGVAPPCGSLTDDGPLVWMDRIAEDAPTPKGGVIHDGVYLLTTRHMYTGPRGPSRAADDSRHMSFEFYMTSDTTGRFEVLGSITDSSDVFACGTVALSGTTFVIDPTSPPGGSAIQGVYSATPSEVQLEPVIGDSPSIVETYTRR